jgi:hypothetical protein
MKFTCPWREIKIQVVIVFNFNEASMRSITEERAPLEKL